jgi:membrane protein implicated in regulation of membrane protease activity
MVPLIWAIAGLALILAEFVVPEFVIFFFGLGALLNSLVLALVPGLGDNILIQIVIWLGFSTLSLFGFRRYLSRWFKGRKFEQDDKAEFIGKRAQVLEDITPEKPGRIRFGGTSWVAFTYDEKFSTGETVEIIRREGTRFLVTGSITGLPDASESSDDSN